MQSQIYSAMNQSLKDRRGLMAGMIAAILSLTIFISLPVVTIPGNDLIFQLKIFRVQDYLLMLALAILIGLNFALQFYGRKQKRRNAVGVPKTISGGVLSGIIGTFGAMVGTGSCPACLAFLFGLIGLGAGSALFVLEHQVYFLGGSIVAILISLYFTPRKVNNICGACCSPEKHH